MRIDQLLFNVAIKTTKRILSLSLCVLFAFLYSMNAVAQTSAVAVNAKAAENPEIKKLLQYYDKQIYFTENKGQWPVSVLFKADFPLGQAVATKEGMMVSTFDQASIAARSADVMKEEKARKKGLPYKLSEGSIKGHAWMMNFVNHSASMSIETQSMHKDFFNYVQSGNSKPVMNVSNYQEVWYKDVYDKVDVRYYPSATGTLEYDIVCKPGFNKKDIAIRYEGIDKITLEKNGGVALKTSVGDMEFPAPVAYQRINGKQKSIEAEYELIGNNVLTFKVSKFDASQPLIIDPIALRWATWITNNSQGDDHGHCIWVDPNSNSQSIYIAARILGTGLITTPGAFDNSYNGDASGSTDDIVLGKYIQPDSVGGSGTRVWQTYYGGHDEDNPYAMEQGPDGNLYVTGITGSQNFPMSGSIDGDNTFSSEPAGIDDRSQITSNNNDKIFVLKFDTTGTAFKAAVIGGNGDDDPFDIRITQYGDMYVCGYTNSTNLANAGLHMTRATSGNNGGIDCFVFKINSLLDSIYWFSNYGGSGADQNNIMLHDTGTGNLFVGGQTKSTDFPVTNPRQGERGGSEDGFLQKMDSNGVVIWSSYFNSAKGDSSTVICMEFNTTHDKLYFGGITEGLDTSNVNIVADTTAYDTTYNGGNADFFVSLMDTAQNLLKSTYLGGKASETNMMGLNVDGFNAVYIFGYSNSTNFPITTDALQKTINPGAGNNALASDHDMTFTKLSAALDSVIYSTFYGGGIDDYDPVGERGIKFSQCRIYTIVTAGSQNIPLTAGAITTNKLSGSTQNSTTYEPGLMVWANPPDLVNNTITGNQTICAGTTPSTIMGSLPSYVLPQITRNGNVTAYPDTFATVPTYDWQYSSDSIHWKDVPGGNTQNLAGSLVPTSSDTIYLQRIINGDACFVPGPSKIVILSKFAVTGTVTNVTCFGMDNGSVTITSINGTAPYQYSWSNGATTSSITNLYAGTYKVVVKDASGCSTDTTPFIVSQPSAPLSATKSSTPSTCGNSNGSASVFPSGGTTPYYYLWSTDATTSSISSVPQGTYTVTVTDTNKCSVVIVDTVTNLNGPSVPTVIDVDNCGSSTLSTTATGNLLWNTGATTSSITVSIAGTYSVTQTDANGCTSLPGTGTAAPYSAPATPNVQVNNYCNYSVLSTAATGALLWSPGGATTSSITVTDANTYSVTATANGCPSAPGSGTSAPYPTPATPTVQVNNYCNYSVLSTTSTGSLLWSPGGATTSSITVTDANTYSVTATANGCPSAPGTGTSAPYPTPAAPVVQVNNYCNYSVLSTTSTGSLLWSPGGATTSSITVTVAGTYSVTATANGCPSAPGTGTSAPYPTPATPTIQVNNYCNYSVLSTTSTGALLWSPGGATTSSITVTVAGTYSVTATANGCPSAPGTGTSAPYPTPATPTVQVNNYCNYSVLSTTSTGALLWSPGGATTSSITVTDANTYSVTATANGCPSAPGTGTSAPYPTPSTPVVQVNNYCGYSVLSTTATGVLLWSPGGATTSSITVTVAGTYSVTATANGCPSAPGTGTSAPYPTPATPTVQVNNYCNYSVLSTTSTGALLWSPGGATTSSITVTDANTYSVTATANGCPSAPGTGTSAPYPTPSTPVVQVDNYCGYSVLSTTATGVLLWSPGGATTTSITVTAAGTYSVTATANGCPSAPGSGTSAPYPTPTTPVVQVNNYCNYSVLSTTSTGALLWSPGGATTSSITVTDANTYSVTATANGCPSAPGTGTSAPYPTPATPTVQVNNYCNYSVLSTTSTGALLWSPGGATTSTITVTDANTYSVTVTANGCPSAPGTGTSAPYPTPATPTVQVNNYCNYSVLSTTATGALLWSPGGATTSAITVTDANTYSVTATANGCPSAPGTGTSAPYPTPATPVVQVNNYCNYSVLSTSATGALLWSPGGATTSSITVTVAGTYSVTATANGCPSAPGSGTSAPYPTPATPVVQVNNYCNYSVLSTTSTGALLWSPGGATTSSITVTNAATYSVTATANGCPSAPGTGTSAPYPTPPTPTVQVNNYCNYSVLSTAATGALLWSPGGATTSSITVTNAATYSVTATANGCPSAPGSGTSAPYPTPATPVVKVNNYCGSSVLSTTATGTLLWSPGGATTSSITVTAAGTYSVTATTSGCPSAPGAGTAAPYTTPAAPKVTVVNSCGSSLLTASGFTGTLSWNTGATTSSITVTTAGTYSVTQTVNGCISLAGTGVAAPGSQQPSCTISGNSSICSGQSSSLCAPAGNSSYKWSTGATTSCITISSAGTYTLTVSNGPGCSCTSSKCVTANPTPSCNITTGCGGNSTCNGQGTSLCGAGGCSSYLWSTGAKTQCINVTTSGTYSLTVTNSSGCSSTCSQVITIGTPPSCTISGSSTLCSGQSTTLSAPSGTGLKYSWSTGATSSSIVVSSSATYYVTVSNSSGCSSMCSKSVTVSSPPSCTITTGCGSNHSCNGQGTIFYGPAGCTGYKWSCGATTSCVTVNQTCTYTLTCTNSSGCTNSCSQGFTIGTCPPCSIIGDSVLCNGSCTKFCAPSGLSGYKWSCGATTSCISVTPGSTCAYSVIVTNSAGCTNTCSKPCTVNPVPSCTITGTTCIWKGSYTTLYGPSGCSSYKWSTGCGNSYISVCNSGTYCVTVTNSSGCSNTGTACISYSCGRMISDSSSSADADNSINATAYPNPFNSFATIEFSNANAASRVSVEIYGLDGNKVATLFDENTMAGVVYKVEFDAANLSDGIYIYRITSDDSVINGKLILLRH